LSAESHNELTKAVYPTIKRIAKNNIFKRAKRGLSLLGKTVLAITEIDWNARKNFAGVQRPGKKSIDERNCIIIYIFDTYY
jgi:hypothetical protein